MKRFRQTTSVYFIGIGGIAMSSVAVAMQHQGFRVGGSDQQIYPPASELLGSTDVKLYTPYSEHNLRDFAPDLVVVGNSVSRGNPEVEYVLSHRLPFMSLPELVKREIVEGAFSIVVTGTHGKTTTTALIAWILERAGYAPGFLVGGIPGNFSSGFRYPQRTALADTPVVVLEGDEYDAAFFDKRSKFLHYLPSVLVMNNLEYDHADIFPDMAALKQQFRWLLRLVPADGLLVANGDDANVMEVLRTGPVYTSNIRRFSFNEQGEVHITILETTPQGSFFQIHDQQSRTAQEFWLPIPGRHMVSNAVAAITAVQPLAISHQVLQHALETFRLPRRRLERKVTAGEITVYEDFAHHPTALRATLQALRQQHPEQRLIAVVEPRSNTMVQRIFQQPMAEALQGADVVFFAPPYRYQRYAPEDRLDIEQLARQYRQQGKQAEAVPPQWWDRQWSDWLLERLQSIVVAGDVVVFFSNGAFDGLVQKFVEQLEHLKQIDE